ncbi:radical SAM family heme chaperone HemW [Flavobacteriales bacterium]|nr:radical SAM family heme chaperone HemW [Flavobacteriales bacterium]
MSGVYLHIPFCKKACHYCDFHFSTSMQTKDLMIKSMVKEIDVHCNFTDTAIETIYFGGGTPSILGIQDIDTLLNKIKKTFLVVNEPEITFEANPDDLTSEKLRELKNAGINRLSIGIQSFHDDDLLLMNRAHSCDQAINSIKLAQEEGFSNISIDLIYGLPGLSASNWSANIQNAIDLNVQHISAYCLTIEKKTVFYNWHESNKIILPDDQQTLDQFVVLTDLLVANGFEHYEISNFGKQGYYSKHNSNYWLQEKYLGIGPSAHSFNGQSRMWNVRNNNQYIKAIAEKTTFYDQETLTPRDHFNEYILTRLRTKWGINKAELKDRHQTYYAILKKQMKKWLDQKMVLENDTFFVLSPSGKFIADRIISDLFIIDE